MGESVFLMRRLELILRLIRLWWHQLQGTITKGYFGFAQVHVIFHVNLFFLSFFSFFFLQGRGL